MQIVLKFSYNFQKKKYYLQFSMNKVFKNCNNEMQYEIKFTKL